MKKNNNPMAQVVATTRKTVAYANVHPESFRPGTGSYAWFEQMSGICTAGLERFTTMEQARPLLDILELFAETDRPEAKVLYASYLSKEDKPWYNPFIAKIMLMRAIDDVKEDNPHAAEVMFIYGLHVLEGRGWFKKDVTLATKWITRAAELGSPEAQAFLPLIKRMERRK